jgi:chemotaxis protein CheD
MIAVRMGEIAVSSRGGDELTALGLGSCIGLALVDRDSGVAGLAHVVLPDSRGDSQTPGKYADLAVPELISQLRRAGAAPHRLEAVLAGGARMFELGGELDIGARNEAAVRAALSQARIGITATATGGNRGRTLRVFAVEGTVSVREAGGEATTLLNGKPGRASLSGGAAPLTLRVAGA